MEGTIFDIKECSIHDGPGMRTTVFLKGCPLHCLWCHNPEGLRKEPQLTYKKNMCAHCGNCYLPCGHPECAPFGRCVHACPNGCLEISGRTISSEALAEKIESYRIFFDVSGGGVTFSGGEPLMQGDFVCEVADALNGIHKAIQTSGYAPEEIYRRVVERMDYVLQDIKLADPALHRQYTGVDNARILRNIAWLKESGKPFVFRVPLIPNITDTPENLKQIARITEDFPVELLPYNKLAGAKYEMLGLEYPLGSIDNREDAYTSYFQNAVLRGS